MKRIFSTLVGIIFGGAIALLLSLNAFLIVMFAVLFGLVGFLHAKNSPASKQDSNRPKRIQFSLMRLLLATSMVALVFGLSRILYDFKEPAEIITSSVIAIALGVLTLICKKSDLKGVFLTMIICIFLGILFLIWVHSIRFD